MAPHDTNVEKEAKRHATPLITMGILVVLVLLGFLWWVSGATQGPEEVQENAAEAPATTQSETPPTTQMEQETPPAATEPAVPGSNSPAAPAPEQPGTTAPAMPGAPAPTTTTP